MARWAKVLGGLGTRVLPELLLQRATIGAAHGWEYEALRLHKGQSHVADVRVNYSSCLYANVKIPVRKQLLREPRARMAFGLPLSK
jgi:hypothetical protein